MSAGAGGGWPQHLQALSPAAALLPRPRSAACACHASCLPCYAASSSHSPRGSLRALVPCQPFQTLPPACRWDRLAAQHGGALAVLDPHHQPSEEYSFEQLAAVISQFAAGLQALGLR